MSGDFLFLNARAGWRAGQLQQVELADDGAALRLSHAPGSARPLADKTGSLGGLVLPIGLAVDGEGRIYILDGGATVIKRYDPCAEEFFTLPCVGGKGSAPRQLNDPRGIAITRRGDMFVADAGNARVQVFALKDLVLRNIWNTPRAAKLPAPWLPVDVAATSQNCILVCDYANGLIHRFDPSGKWREAWDGADAASQQPALHKPTRIAVDAHDHVYILQEGKEFVVVLDERGCWARTVQKPDEIKGEFCPVAIAVDANGTIFISDRAARKVFACGKGKTSAAKLALAECPSLAFDKTGQLLVGDGANKCVAFVQPAQAFETEGVFITQALDSELYRCEWHRARMQASVPAGTQIRVDTFTAEAEFSSAEIASLPETRWATAQFNAQVGDGLWDCLTLSEPGRYLWLRLTLLGDGAHSPEVRWLKMEYPRNQISAIQFLPAVYREDAAGKDFLGRFLSIFDAISEGIDDSIATLERLFDPLAAPTSADARRDFLGWLAGWFDLVLDRTLPVWRKRLLLKNAHTLFALRGTPAGLRLHIQLYFGAQARILEHFKLRRWLFVDSARLGDSSVLYGWGIVKRLQLDEFSRIGEFQLIDTGDPLRDPFYVFAHGFTLALPTCAGLSVAQKRALDRIIEASKPAHTQATVRVTRPRFRLNGETYLGLDTVLGTYPDKVTVGDAAQKLGYDTVLGASRDEAAPPNLRIGKQSRIGDMTLN